MSRSEDVLVGQYAPLVRRQALQMMARLPSSVELDDLIQAGMMGLLDAIRRYQQMADAEYCAIILGYFKKHGMIE